jgi:hypothetical protein
LSPFMITCAHARARARVPRGVRCATRISPARSCV